MYYMREILNISLSKEMVKGIKRDVKDGGFSSVSEFVRAAVREYRIQKFLRTAKKAEKEFHEGKTTTINSFTELRKFK